MIYKKSDFSFSVFQDSRGQSGMSGQLQLAKYKDGMSYLVKTGDADIANEYVAHRLAKLIGVPTSDAVLITDKKGLYGVGIVREPEFQRISMDDFLGTEENNRDEIPVFIGERPYTPPKITAPKYPDDSPFLADAMRYIAFRHMIVLEDVVQLAVSQGRVISFDYAESFCILSTGFGIMLRTGKAETALGNFVNYLHLKNSYKNGIEILRRPDTVFLRAAHDEPFRRFLHVDREPILSDLDEVYPPVVANFYYNCFEYIQDKINELK